MFERIRISIVWLCAAFAVFALHYITNLECMSQNVYLHEKLEWAYLKSTEVFVREWELWYPRSADTFLKWYIYPIPVVILLVYNWISWIGHWALQTNENSTSNRALAKAHPFLSSLFFLLGMSLIWIRFPSKKEEYVYSLWYFTPYAMITMLLILEFMKNNLPFVDFVKFKFIARGFIAILSISAIIAFFNQF